MWPEVGQLEVADAYVVNTVLKFQSLDKLLSLLRVVTV